MSKEINGTPRVMAPGEPRTKGAEADGAGSLSTRELLGRIASEGQALVRKEMQLARTELAADLKTEVRTVKAIGAGTISAFVGLNMLFVTLALALAEVMAGWIAALLVSAALLLTAAVVAGVGWTKRVRRPLERTRRHLKEDVRWMKQRLA